MCSESKLSLSDICQGLGLQPQFLLDLSYKTSSLYITFDRPKRSGGVRTISAPQDELKRIQRLIYDGILSKADLPPYVHGCVKGRSILTNAAGHINKPLVINIDLVNFFGSIRFDRVAEIFRNQFRCDDDAATALARLTTFGDSLPQGAPTSPVIANLSALPLDSDLIEICERNARSYRYDYSRYVDDITISGGTDLAFLLHDFYTAVHKHGFRANPKKLKVSRPSARQKVTGVIVNQKLNAPKKLIRKLRQQLYYCTKHGFDNHCEQTGVIATRFLHEIKGWLGYARMMRPELIDDFEIRLGEARQKSAALAGQEQEQTLNYLNHIIEMEGTATFTYRRSSRRVAPAEIFLDDSGIKILRAFQLSPDQGWRTFEVSQIKGLSREGDRLN
jgi:RNA-directed DNA polymerase